MRIPNWFQFCNLQTKINLAIMKWNNPNHHTEATPIRDSQISHTQSAFQTTHEDEDESISKKFKEFLIQNSPSYRKNLRPHTIDQHTRININNSMKKSAIYRKLLNSSSDRCTMAEEMARYRQKFESAARKGVKEISPVVFREFWEQEQKKKFADSKQNSHSVKFRVEGRNKTNSRDIQSDIKSFESFINSQKRGTSKKNTSENYNLISITVGQEATEEHLKVAGNHKQLRKKQKDQFLKRLGLRKNKTQVLAKEVRVNPEEASFQDFTQFQKEKKQIEDKSLRTSQNREQSKIGKYGTCHFKNLYSPYNGIQIKYISLENPPIELHPSSKKIVPKNHYPVRTFFKKKHPQVKEKSIVFKQKNRNKVDAARVEGWNIEPDFNEDISDMCHL